MSKEMKIGLAVVGVLMLAFGTLLVHRLIATEMARRAEPDASQPAALASSNNNEKPRVVPAQKDRVEPSGAAANNGMWAKRGRTAEAGGEAAADMPHASFLPSERATAESDAAPSPRNPFQRNQPTERVDLQAVETADQPTSRDEIPANTAGFDESIAEPSREARPLGRRLSAQIPVEEPVPASDPASPESDSAIADVPAEVPQEQPLAAVAEEANPPLEAVEPAPSGIAPRYRSSSLEERPLEVANEPSPPEDGKYTIQPNDNLWIVSEKVYGTGRYFKAIAEHNRNVLPRSDRLTVGTVISVPPVSELQQSYPALVPKQRRSALVKPRTVQASARGRVAPGNVYIVEEGDTLFDIARFELGKASRWAEIYDLNRESLGEDFDYLQPGTELVMPTKTQPDAVTRGRDSRYQR